MSREISSEPIWHVAGAEEDEGFGISVATAGDVNGDGYADFAVGAERYDGSTTDCGRAWVFLGSSTENRTRVVTWRPGTAVTRKAGACRAGSASCAWNLLEPCARRRS